MSKIQFVDGPEILGGMPVEFGDELGGFSLRKVTRSVKSKALKPVARGAKKLASSNAAQVVQKVAKTGKTVVRSPYVRVGAAGLAVVFPPAGVPAMAAVETANLVLNAAEKGQKQAKDIVEATRKLAAAGNADAKRGLVVLDAQSKARSAIRTIHASPVAGKVRPKPLAAVKPSVSATLQQAKAALTPGTGKPPPGSIAVRGLFVTREGLVFRP
jgi:hypothetical protein